MRYIARWIKYLFKEPKPPPRQLTFSERLGLPKPGTYEAYR